MLSLYVNNNSVWRYIPHHGKTLYKFTLCSPCSPWRINTPRIIYFAIFDILPTVHTVVHLPTVQYNVLVHTMLKKFNF